MSALKLIADRLPPSIRKPLVTAWRKYRGNPEFNALRILSVPSKLALDVGANAGAYSRELIRYSSGCIAFEPVPGLAKMVKEKYGHLGVVVHACALSDQDGTVTLRIPIFNGVDAPQNASVEPEDLTIGTNTKNIEVPRKRLDDFEFQPVGLIKIDAEGHEESVLRGAIGLIERDRPSVLVEADENRHKAGCVTAVRKYFFDRGYSGFFLLGRNIRPIDRFEPSRHQNKANLDQNNHVIFNREYVDTFIFVSDGSLVEKLSRMATNGTTL